MEQVGVPALGKAEGMKGERKGRNKGAGGFWLSCKKAPFCRGTGEQGLRDVWAPGGARQVF